MKFPLKFTIFLLSLVLIINLKVNKNSKLENKLNEKIHKKQIGKMYYIPKVNENKQIPTKYDPRRWKDKVDPNEQTPLPCEWEDPNMQYIYKDERVGASVVKAGPYEFGGKVSYHDPKELSKIKNNNPVMRPIETFAVMTYTKGTKTSNCHENSTTS